MSDETPINQLDPKPLTPAEDPVTRGESNTPLTTAPPPFGEDKKSKKKFVLITVLILLVLAGAVSAWLMTHKNPVHRLIKIQFHKQH